MWALAALAILFIVAPISIVTGLVLLMTTQIAIGLIVIIPGGIIFGWLVLDTTRSVATMEDAYQKYMSGTFTEEDRQKLAEQTGISDSLARKGE